MKVRGGDGKGKVREGREGVRRAPHFVLA